MSQLIVFGFTDQFRAAEVLNDLKRRELDWVVDLDHAVVVMFDDAGQPKVQLSVDLTVGETTAWASFWGSLLSVTLFLPTTEMLKAAENMTSSLRHPRNGSRHTVAPPAASWWSNELGLDELFLRDIGAMVKDGGSAIFMLLHLREGVMVRRELQNYGNMIIHASLSAEQDRKISDFFALR